VDLKRYEGQMTWRWSLANPFRSEASLTKTQRRTSGRDLPSLILSSDESRHHLFEVMTCSQFNSSLRSFYRPFALQ
jgi:hypothetical protein